MQSKRQSFIETCSNTFIGMLGSWLIMMAVLYTIDNKVVVSVVTVVLCTIWSIVRGYCVRRYFNSKGIDMTDKKEDKLRAPIADESPMAKMADALREKARQEQQAYQDRRNQATEWGPIPEGTEADSAHVADERELPTLPVAWGSAINDAGDGHVDLYSAEQMQEYARAALASAPVAGEAQPVAYRAWFDQDSGARWLFTLWPEEERLDVQWEPLYAAPPVSEK